MWLRSLDLVLDWFLNLNLSPVLFVLLPVVASVLLFLCYFSIWGAVLCAVAAAVLYLGSWRGVAMSNYGSDAPLLYSDYLGDVALTRPHGIAQQTADAMKCRVERVKFWELCVLDSSIECCFGEEVQSVD